MSRSRDPIINISTEILPLESVLKKRNKKGSQESSQSSQEEAWLSKGNILMIKILQFHNEPEEVNARTIYLVKLLQNPSVEHQTKK